MSCAHNYCKGMASGRILQGFICYFIFQLFHTNARVNQKVLKDNRQANDRLWKLTLKSFEILSFQIILHESMACFFHHQPINLMGRKITY